MKKNNNQELVLTMWQMLTFNPRTALLSKQPFLWEACLYLRGTNPSFVSFYYTLLFHYFLSVTPSSLSISYPQWKFSIFCVFGPEVAYSQLNWTVEISNPCVFLVKSGIPLSWCYRWKFKHWKPDVGLR